MNEVKHLSLKCSPELKAEGSSFCLDGLQHRNTTGSTWCELNTETPPVAHGVSQRAMQALDTGHCFCPLLKRALRILSTALIVINHIHFSYFHLSLCCTHALLCQ